MNEIIQKNRLNKHEPSYDEIQNSFPVTKTLEMEKRSPGSSRSDEFFGDRMLNGFNPILFKKDRDNPNHYVTTFDGTKFELRMNEDSDDPGIAIDLPNYKVKFELKDDRLLPIEIQLQFRHENCIQINPPLQAWQTYTPANQETWLQAKRVVRATHLGVLGEVKVHLAQCHFNMEQYAIAFFRNIRNSPIRSFLYPHIKEVVHINNFGRRILMDPTGGFFARVQPMKVLPDMLKWVRSCMGTYDWTDWTPRKPLCESHVYAKIGNLYWGILTTYVDDFFANNHAGIVKYWDEIHRFSEDLVKYGVPYEELSMEQVDDGNEWYDMGEVDTSLSPRRTIDGVVKAVRPITSSSTASESDIANLKQVCRYLIYHLTYVHSGIHIEHNPEFGELRYGDLLSNGSMGPEDDNSIMPGQQPAAIILGASNMLTEFTYGYILKNEDGDVPQNLVQLVESHKADFEAFGYDLEKLRSRLNS